MQKHVNLVDLVKSFPTNIYLQNLASIQKRTSPVKFAHLAEKSGKVRYRTFQLRSFSGWPASDGEWAVAPPRGVEKQDSRGSKTPNETKTPDEEKKEADSTLNSFRRAVELRPSLLGYGYSDASLTTEHSPGGALREHDYEWKPSFYMMEKRRMQRVLNGRVKRQGVAG